MKLTSLGYQRAMNDILCTFDSCAARNTKISQYIGVRPCIALYINSSLLPDKTTHLKINTCDNAYKEILVRLFHFQQHVLYFESNSMDA